MKTSEQKLWWIDRNSRSKILIVDTYLPTDAQPHLRSLSLSLSVRSRLSEPCRCHLFFPSHSLSLSLSSYLFPPSFPPLPFFSLLLSVPSFFFFFFFFLQNIAPVSQWGPRLAGSKNEDKEKDRRRVGARNRGGERRGWHT